jgi:hypothetical protein
MANEVTLFRLTTRYGAEGKPRHHHFASLSEAETNERAASVSGATTFLHHISVPTDPRKLAAWLDDAGYSPALSSEVAQ